MDYHVTFEEKKPDGSYAPYVSNDIQLEFIKLDPHYRIFLNHSGKGQYEAHFKAPDTLGVFKFKISYVRYGFTNIEEEAIVSVIQFRHDEFPRFLKAAYPYYYNIYIMMAAGFLFIVFFLYSDVTFKSKA